jgi:hypothetical protein
MFFGSLDRFGQFGVIFSSKDNSNVNREDSFSLLPREDISIGLKLFTFKSILRFVSPTLLS